MILAVELSADQACLLLGDRNRDGSLAIAYRETVPVVQLSDAIARIRREQRKRFSEIRVAVHWENALHTLSLFPPARGRVLRELVLREARSQVGPMAVVQFEELGEVEAEEGKKRKRVQMIALNQADVENALHTFGRYQGQIRLLTTYPVAVRSVIQALGITSAVGVFDIRKSGVGFITILKGKEIRVFRMLRYTLKEEESWALMGKDLQQTLFFHRTTYGGERIQGVYLAGDYTPEIEHVIKQELDVPVFRLRLPGLVEEPISPPLAGLILTQPRHIPYNFIPRRIHERFLIRQVASGTLLVLVLLGSFHATRYLQLLQELMGLRRYAFSLQSEITRTQEELRRMRQEMVAYRVKEIQPPWSDFFLEMSALFPPGALLTRLRVEQQGGEWWAEGEGLVQGTDLLTALGIVTEFESRLSRSPLVNTPEVEKTLGEKDVRFQFRFRVSLRGELQYLQEVRGTVP